MEAEKSVCEIAGSNGLQSRISKRKEKKDELDAAT